MRVSFLFHPVVGLLCLASAACGGGSDDDGGPGPGPPAGEAVTGRIGPAGGELTTPDQGATLRIPAGALSAETDITIRPVQNTAPRGYGLAYAIEPSPLPLSAPAELSLSANALLAANSIPEALGVGLRNAQGEWFGDLGSTTVLEAARGPSTIPAIRDGRVVSVTRVEGNNEWVEYTLTAFWFVSPPAPRTVRTGQSLGITIKTCLREEESANSAGDDILAALPQAGSTEPPGAECRPSIREGTWYVNNERGGNATVGFIAAGGSGPSSVAEFLAPNRVPTPGEVTVRADMFWRARGVTKRFDNIPVTIIGGGLTGSATGSYVGVEPLYSFTAQVTWVKEENGGQAAGLESYKASGTVTVTAVHRCISNLQPGSYAINTTNAGSLVIDRRDGTWSGGAAASPPQGYFTYYDTCAQEDAMLPAIVPILESDAGTPLPVRGQFTRTLPSPSSGSFSYAEE